LSWYESRAFGKNAISPFPADAIVALIALSTDVNVRAR